MKHLARIEEVFRIIEVLESIGVRCRWTNRNRDLEIISPRELEIENINVEAARKTRSILMLMGPLLQNLSASGYPMLAVVRSGRGRLSHISEPCRILA